MMRAAIVAAWLDLSTPRARLPLVVPRVRVLQLVERCAPVRAKPPRPAWLSRHPLVH